MFSARSIRIWWHRLSLRPKLMGFALMLGAMGAALLATWAGDHPQPVVHDEFSYLLASDTFAHGRLTNPTHPMWMFFESMHIIHQPTYASMYPPAQGMAMAVGQVATGDPLVGVWLSIAAMTGAIYWMLRAWMPARWALLGGCLVLMKYVTLGRAASFSVAGYWSQSYVGGAVAALGGALLLGGLGRILYRRPLVHHALAVGVGVAILANSRPFEGALVAGFAAVILLVWLIRQKKHAIRQVALKVIAPIAVVLVPAILFTGVYNQQVTGKWSMLPWQLHHDQYCTFPIFTWQQPKPVGSVHWNHEALEEFHGNWEVSLWKVGRDRGFVLANLGKFKNLWAFYVAPLPRIDPVIDPGADSDQSPSTWRRIVNLAVSQYSVSELIAGLILTLPLLAAPWCFGLRRCAIPIAMVLLVVLGTSVTVVGAPHYAAPAAAAFVLILVQCLRLCWHSRFRVVRLTFGAAMIVTIAAFLASFNGEWRKSVSVWQYDRARLIRELEASGGNHLIVVRYGPHHSVFDEWVYNRADIDNASVVWARDMGDPKNEQLLDYFRDRKVWLLDFTAGGGQPKLGPYR